MRKVLVLGLAILLLNQVPVPGVAADGPSLAPVADAAWLEDPAAASWNVPGMELPAAPDARLPLDPRAVDRERPQEGPPEMVLRRGNWRLYAAAQTGWGVRAVPAAAYYDGMGRPLAYQVFVFVDGQLAGSLAPQPMDSRTDGALNDFALVSRDTLRATFRRYAASDPLCCPSGSAAVDYRIDRTDRGPVVVPTTTKPKPLEAAAPAFGSHWDASYEIEGRTVTLVGGRAETEVAPGSASRVITRYFGNEAVGDLDGDGIEDVVFLLTQDRGGSGTFLYVVVAFYRDGGYAGANGVLLGDRIAPQTTSVQDGYVVVNYAERQRGEAMTAAPSVGVTKTLRVESGWLTEG